MKYEGEPRIHSSTAKIIIDCYTRLVYTRIGLGDYLVQHGRCMILQVSRRRKSRCALMAERISVSRSPGSLVSILTFWAGLEECQRRALSTGDEQPQNASRNPTPIPSSNVPDPTPPPSSPLPPPPPWSPSPSPSPPPSPPPRSPSPRPTPPPSPPPPSRDPSPSPVPEELRTQNERNKDPEPLVQGERGKSPEPVGPTFNREGAGSIRHARTESPEPLEWPEDPMSPEPVRRTPTASVGSSDTQTTPRSDAVPGSNAVPPAIVIRAPDMSCWPRHIIEAWKFLLYKSDDGTFTVPRDWGEGWMDCVEAFVDFQKNEGFPVSSQLSRWK